MINALVKTQHITYII